MTLLQARMTKVVLSGVLFLSAVLFLVPSSFANEIPVVNPSFETLPPGGLPESCGNQGCRFSRQDQGIPGWTIAPGSLAGQHQWGKVPGPFFNFLPASDGITSAYVNSFSISQEVGPTVQAGLDYIFTVDLGHRKDTPFEASADLLLSGGHHSPEIVNAMGTIPNRGNWSTFTATFVGNSSNAGDHITIQLKSGGVQGNFDSVTLTAVPEPETLLLFGSGLLLLGIVVHRKLLHGREISA